VAGYDRRLVERLAPAIWDQTYAYGMTDTAAPDPDMPRSKPDPKLGGTIYAHLADIRSAWKRADLPQVERQALLLRFGLGWTQSEVGRAQGVSQQAAQQRIDRGVGRLVAHLNGKTFADVDSIDGDLEVQV
jgi:DNA-directed RNA polymerase specialized sigma24 family protein